MMKKIMVSMSEEMVKALNRERRERKLESVPEAVRAVLGEYFKASANGQRVETLRKGADSS
jgi:Arc/MetJ-type ribon-helix-helix transcriptional regulator